MRIHTTTRSCGQTLNDLEAQLISLYGGIVGGSRLTCILGYPSQAAFRQAVARGRIPVPVFTIEGRRGKFAHVHDIATWLHQGARVRLAVTTSAAPRRINEVGGAMT